MTELNGCEPRKITVKGPYTFTIGDTTKLGDYKAGGIFTQVKMPKIIEFVRVPSISHASYSRVLLAEIASRVSFVARILHHGLRQV